MREVPSEPIVFISHFRVKPGRLADVRQMAALGSEQLEAAKPGTAAFLPYLSDDGSTFTIVHVFPDAAAMTEHFGGSDQRSAAAYEVIEPAGWEVYGRSPAAALDSLRAEAAAAGVALTVHREALPGFLRTSVG